MVARPAPHETRSCLASELELDSGLMGCLIGHRSGWASRKLVRESVIKLMVITNSQGTHVCLHHIDPWNDSAMKNGTIIGWVAVPVGKACAIGPAGIVCFRRSWGRVPAGAFYPPSHLASCRLRKNLWALAKVMGLILPEGLAHLTIIGANRIASCQPGAVARPSIRY